MAGLNLTTGEKLAASLAMAHYGAKVSAGLMLLAALAAAFWSLRAAGLLAGLSAILFANQLVSRWHYISGLSSLRLGRRGLEVKDREGDQWVGSERVEGVEKTFFPYSDPWRPITVGFPGIRIELSGRDRPVEHLLPYGMEAQRDRAFDRLTELLEKQRS